MVAPEFRHRCSASTAISVGDVQGLVDILQNRPPRCGRPVVHCPLSWRELMNAFAVFDGLAAVRIDAEGNGARGVHAEAFHVPADHLHGPDAATVDFCQEPLKAIGETRLRPPEAEPGHVGHVAHIGCAGS